MQTAEREAADWPAFRVVRHKHNQGKTEAMVSGAAAANGSYLVLFDASAITEKTRKLFFQS